MQHLPPTPTGTGTAIPHQGPGIRSRAAIRSTFAAHIDVGWAVCKEWRGCGHQPEPKHHGCHPDTPPKGPPPPYPVGGWVVAVGIRGGGHPQATPEFLARDATNRLLLCKYVSTHGATLVHAQGLRELEGPKPLPGTGRNQQQKRNVCGIPSSTSCAPHCPLMDPGLDLDLDLRSRRSTCACLSTCPFGASSLNGWPILPDSPSLPLATTRCVHRPSSARCCCAAAATRTTATSVPAYPTFRSSNTVSA